VHEGWEAHTFLQLRTAAADGDDDDGDAFAVYYA
jgi:hypothetical protein